MKLSSLLGLLVIGSISCAESSVSHNELRGVYFNPQVSVAPGDIAWLRDYHLHKNAVNRELAELVEKTDINFIAIFVVIPRTLAEVKVGPRDDAKSISDWARMTFMKNLVSFLEYCGSIGVAVEIDLATNMWIPHSIDANNHKANSEWWPVPDDTPWTEAIVWYTQIIEYVESNLSDTTAIALWCMMGNYQRGASEPVLWQRSEESTEVIRYTERFVKEVWPHFVAAGERPKGAPIMLPLFSNSSSWRDARPMDRLSAVTNLKKWLVDDLKLPADYWLVTNFTNSDPASDNFYYMRALTEIIGTENVGKIITTDFKGPDHDLSDSMIDRSGFSGADMLRWNIEKSREYGYAGWWMWIYRDTPSEQKGIRDITGKWKEDLVQILSDSAQDD